jgi:hypothetical protein
MIEFSDPFERVLSFAQKLWGIEAKVEFVAPQELDTYRWWKFWHEPKGQTFFPDDGSTPVISINGKLRRGVQGTLDILAHELAHVAAGTEAGHGPEWEAAYREIFMAAMTQPVVRRRIG